MVQALLVGYALMGSAAACEGDDCECASAKAADVDAGKVDPAHCARKAELIGTNCSYTTGMMAQRVLEEGRPYTYTGSLAASANRLESRVAAPYGVGPNGQVHVIANEVVDLMIQQGCSDRRVTLKGKLLEVDGVSYFVPTEYRHARS